MQNYEVEVLVPTNLFLICSSLPLPQSDLAEAVSSSGGGVSVRLPSATEKIVTENDKLRKEIKKVLMHTPLVRIACL